MLEGAAFGGGKAHQQHRAQDSRMRRRNKDALTPNPVTRKPSLPMGRKQRMKEPAKESGKPQELVNVFQK